MEPARAGVLSPSGLRPADVVVCLPQPAYRRHPMKTMVPRDGGCDASCVAALEAVEPPSALAGITTVFDCHPAFQLHDQQHG